MSLNEQPSAERLHIAVFGKTNAGKSSLVNALTDQELSVVSPVKGTTTDPVRKSMELLPLGPVVIIDTPGLDDTGSLGELRVRQAEKIIGETDIALIVLEGEESLGETENALIRRLRENGTPFLIVRTKADLLTGQKPPQGSLRDISAAQDGGSEGGIARKPRSADELYVSAETGEGIEALKNKLGTLSPKTGEEKRIVSDLIDPGDTVILVTPIDAAAPKGRLILPQQQTLRDILDHHGMALVCQEEELPALLACQEKKPALVITDSQAFQGVAKKVPADIPLTSFSILFARYKGELSTLRKGAEALKKLKDGSRVLVAEGCTHHRQCGDIGTEKLPAWIREYTKALPAFTFLSGRDFPEELDSFELILHCGGCMLNEKEMKNRMNRAEACGIPIVNYGIAIAAMKGILERSMAVFNCPFSS